MCRRREGKGGEGEGGGRKVRRGEGGEGKRLSVGGLGSQMHKPLPPGKGVVENRRSPLLPLQGLRAYWRRAGVRSSPCCTASLYGSRMARDWCAEPSGIS